MLDRKAAINTTIAAYVVFVGKIGVKEHLEIALKSKNTQGNNLSENNAGTNINNNNPIRINVFNSSLGRIIINETISNIR